MLLFAGLLLFQVAIPVQRLLSEDVGGQTRFGWQMFAGFPDRPVYVVRHVSGRIDTVDIADYVVRQRPEIDFASALPPHLCRQLEGVSEVTVRWPAVGQRSVPRRIDHPCPRREGP